MKTVIFFFVVAALSVMLSVEWAAARGNHRSNLDQKWKQVQAEQERQKREWKRIDGETGRIERGTDTQSIIQFVPSGGRQWQCP
jgi:hypothetical protein